MTAQTPAHLFSASLRKRRELGAVADVLLAEENPKWRGTAPPSRQVLLLRPASTDDSKETKLEPHDLAVPCARAPGQPPDGYFLFVLLSAIDIGTPQMQHLVERLSHVQGGTHAAIIFLLGEDGAQGSVDFMRLQIE